MAAFERVRRLSEIHPCLTATELRPVLLKYLVQNGCY
jgi:hypothetical protein